MSGKLLAIVLATLAIFVQAFVARAGPFLDQVVSELGRLLEDESEIVRAAAAKALGELGPVAEPSLPALIRLLEDPEPSVREAAATALGAIGAAPEDVIPILLQALADEELQVAVAAMRALGGFGSAAEPALPFILQAIQEGTYEMRAAAAEALGKIASVEVALEPLLSALRDPTSVVRRAAAQALATYGSPAVPGLVEALYDERSWMAAISALSEIGVPVVPALLERPPLLYPSLLVIERIGFSAIPVLLESLRSGPEHVRSAAATAIGWLLGVAAEQGQDRVVADVLPSLRQALMDESSQVRSYVVEALARVGPEVEGVEASLVQALTDDDVWVAEKAAWALGELRCQKAVPHLLEVVEDQTLPYRLRAAAAEALGKIGAKEALPVLIEAARKLQIMGPNELIVPGVLSWWEEVLFALGMLGDPAAVPVLAEALRAPSLPIRHRAAEALGRLGAKEAVPELLTAMEDPSLGIQTSAALALLWLGPETLEAAGASIDQVESLFPEIRQLWWEKCALETQTREDRQTVRCLAQALSSGRPLVRRWAAMKLEELGPAAGEAAPALVQALIDDEAGPWARSALLSIGPAAVTPLCQALAEPSLRTQAAEILAEMGPPATNALIQALSHPDPEVRETAAFALGRAGLATKEVISSLAKALQDDEDGVRWRAAEALGKLGPGAGEAVPQLIRALQDPALLVRAKSARALGDIGPDALTAVPALIRALNDGFRMVRENAAYSLLSIGLSAPQALRPALRALSERDVLDVPFPYQALETIDPDAIPILADFLLGEDGSPWIREQVAKILASGPAGEVAPVLARALASQEPLVRWAAAWALGELGPEAVEAAVDLLPLLKDEWDAVRAAAARALGTLLRQAQEGKL